MPIGTKSSLLQCTDSAAKQFVLYLNEKLELGRRFVLEDLDSTTLLIDDDPTLKTQIKQKFELFTDKNTYEDKKQ
eukprot:snap_masked-scaffold_21-processed-gene-4.2-mRNA-1 protein AED:0.01 eAED:0.02 QI:0/-1/0/1/-1/1/1/0/74